MAHFFISYQRDSKLFANELKVKLAEVPILCWIDENIPLGDDWRKVIDMELSDCVGVIVIVTHKALKSPYVTYEWSYALGLGKRVIPVILEKFDVDNPNHPKLDSLNYVDFTNPDEPPWNQLISNLLDVVKENVVPQEIRNAEFGLYSFEPNIRKQATAFLLNHKHHSVGEIFLKAIYSESPEISGNASVALASITKYKDERAVQGLGVALHIPGTQDSALEALVNINSPASVKCLSEEFWKSVESQDNLLRIKLMKTIARISDPSVVPELRKILHSADSVQMEIIDALGRFHDSQALQGLFEYIQMENVTPAGKTRAAKAIGLIGSIDGAEVLFNLANSMQGLQYDYEHALFTAIVEALGTIGKEVSVQYLDKLANDRRFGALRNFIEKVKRQVVY